MGFYYGIFYNVRMVFNRKELAYVVICLWRCCSKSWGALDGDEMTKSEWQQKYQITDEEMNIIELMLSIYKGKIVGIKERKENP